MEALTSIIKNSILRGPMRFDGKRPRLFAIASLFGVGLVCWSLVLGPLRAPALGGDDSVPSETDAENLHHFTDLPVVTQDGKEVRFYSDLLKGRRVVINFFYVDCPTAPPALMTLSKLQDLIGDQLGSDVIILSVDVDPQRDDLESVRKYAERFKPRQGWYFITGKPENLDVINRRLGNTERLPEGHLRQYLLGNLRTNHWVRLVDSAPAQALASGIKSLAP